MDEIVEVLMNKTQNRDKGFFRTEVAYFFGKMASSMRAIIVTKDRGEIPVNIYALALASSGYGKGHSVAVMETEVLGGFKKRFLDVTLPTITDMNLHRIAKERAERTIGREEEISEDDAYKKVVEEYRRKGAYPFTFDSGTSPAVKQLRQKLLMAEAGSINLQIDEIGLNLLANTEVLTLFLELYDQGMVKQKLTKNTSENERDEELDGKTPTNMLLFGTPAKLLDGGDTEDQFYGFLDTGYARRCIFGWGHADRRASHQLSAEEVYKRLINPSNAAASDKWAAHFTNLADPAKFGWKMQVDDDVAIKLIEYKIQCEIKAEELPEHEEIRKAEITHRYFKALKLAGAYAFIDESSEVEMDHLLSAIRLVEESGTSFEQLLNREKAYVRLCKYIVACGTEVTHADLHESLPFYKQGNQTRNELMALAMAWGVKRRMLIKKTFVNGIEFFKGETLKKTNLDELIISYSGHWAYHYEQEPVPFSRFHELALQPDMHWANHGFQNKHRAEENVIPGFNAIVLDVDKGMPLVTAMDLMKTWKFFVYTTKRHTDVENRFRMFIPIAFHLELDAEEYREFMNNIMNWLPFPIDEQANQRSRKWLTNSLAAAAPGYHRYNVDGEILDPLPFIPKTQKNEQFHEELKKIENLDNLERWFAQRIAMGNRNNNLLKFAMALVDSGKMLPEVERAVYTFNDKLQPSLPKQEIANTIMKSVAKRYVKP